MKKSLILLLLLIFFNLSFCHKQNSFEQYNKLMQAKAQHAKHQPTKNDFTCIGSNKLIADNIGYIGLVLYIGQIAHKFIANKLSNAKAFCPLTKKEAESKQKTN